jgi:hypothetical protein
MSNRGVDLAVAMYEREASDCNIRDRLVVEGLSVRSASTAMYRARSILKRQPDGTIKRGSINTGGAEWDYRDKIILPAEAAFLAALRANEQPPANLALDERSVPLRIGAFVG